jgi:hypothetical protein
MLYLLPKATIMQVRVVQQIFRGSHDPPGETAFLGGMVGFFRWQAGDEVGDQPIDNVRRVLCYDRRVLVLWIP